MNAAILEKARKYCAYSERCHSEVRNKLLGWKVYGDELEEIMDALIAENYLNEERYAASFAQGKFRINHWGKTKIRLELKARKVSDYSIRKGLEEIDADEYLTVIKDLIRKRQREKPGDNAYQVVNYLLSRGFETDLIRSILNEPD